jgi:hypothetical protein
VAVELAQGGILCGHRFALGDQAVVTDQIVSGRGKEARTMGLLMAGTEKAMEIIEPRSTAAMLAPGGGSEEK